MDFVFLYYNSSYKPEDEKLENDHVTHSNVLDPGQITQADVEEATIIAFDMILENKMNACLVIIFLFVSKWLNQRVEVHLSSSGN
ncbi:putative thiol oxidase [Helianthus debilis subsp. tardiflorus]